MGAKVGVAELEKVDILHDFRKLEADVLAQLNVTTIVVEEVGQTGAKKRQYQAEVASVWTIEPEVVGW